MFFFVCIRFYSIFWHLQYLFGESLPGKFIYLSVFKSPKSIRFDCNYIFFFRLFFFYVPQKGSQRHIALDTMSHPYAEYIYIYIHNK